MNNNKENSNLVKLEAYLSLSISIIIIIIIIIRFQTTIISEIKRDL